MNVITVVGARPQFVKAAVVSHALREAGISEQIVHTGQHYDADMSQVFFDELGIPAPAVNLGVGSGSHATQTGAMMTGLEEVLSVRHADWLLTYGDTNSTIASALVAAKADLPVAHVEAGLRSFNRRMPEEINRIATDRLSTLLFCPTRTAVDHLRREGITSGVHLTGDVMLDATRFFADRAAERRPVTSVLDNPPDRFALATVHRAENTDDPARLKAIIETLGQLDIDVILPLHPRTRSRLAGIDIPDRLRLIEPVTYLSMLSLIRGAERVLTDSGGLQKEAVWLDTPCITLRDETEWTETLEGNWNQIVGADPDAILDAWKTQPVGPAPEFGKAVERGASAEIARLLESESPRT